MDAFGKMDDHPAQTIPHHNLTKTDVLSKTFVQINLADKRLIRHSRTSPQPTATTFAFSFFLFFFYDYTSALTCYDVLLPIYATLPAFLTHMFNSNKYLPAVRYPPRFLPNRPTPVMHIGTKTAPPPLNLQHWALNDFRFQAPTKSPNM